MKYIEILVSYCYCRRLRAAKKARSPSDIITLFHGHLCHIVLASDGNPSIIGQMKSLWYNGVKLC